MSSSFWSDACIAARNKPVQAQLDVIYATHSVTVFAYCVSALAGGTMFYRWWRLKREQKDRTWRLYGWFSGLTATGSFVGILTWIVSMLQLVSNVTASEMLQRALFKKAYLLYAEAAKYNAMFAVTHAFEFLFLSSALLMVLDRMAGFAMPQLKGSTLWARLEKLVMAFVVAGNVVGLFGNIVTADFYRRSSERSLLAYNDAVVNFNASRSYATEAKALNDDASSAESVQSFCEFSVLLLIVCAFSAVGMLCLRRIKEVAALLRGVKSALESAAAAEGRFIRKQILCTTLFVFVAFLLRSIQSAIDALSFLLSDSYRSCESNNLGLCNPNCYNMWTHMLRWYERTPEFETSIILISSPLALLVALWGMTSRSLLTMMRKERDHSLEFKPQLGAALL